MIRVKILFMLFGTLILKQFQRQNALQNPILKRLSTMVINNFEDGHPESSSSRKPQKIIGRRIGQSGTPTPAAGH